AFAPLASFRLPPRGVRCVGPVRVLSSQPSRNLLMPPSFELSIAENYVSACANEARKGKSMPRHDLLERVWQGCCAMKRRMWLAGVLVALLWAAPAKAADTGVIVRTTAGLPVLQTFCSLPTTCTVVGGALDGALGQVFLVTT